MLELPIARLACDGFCSGTASSAKQGQPCVSAGPHGASSMTAHEQVEVLAAQSRISHFQFAVSELVGSLLNPCTRGSFPGRRNRRAGDHK